MNAIAAHQLSRVYKRCVYILVKTVELSFFEFQAVGNRYVCMSYLRRTRYICTCRTDGLHGCVREHKRPHDPLADDDLMGRVSTLASRRSIQRQRHRSACLTTGLQATGADCRFGIQSFVCLIPLTC